MNKLNEVEEFFYNLVKVKSDTNTILEIDVENYIYNELGKMKYFSDNADNYGLYKLKDDNIGRCIVWGLVKGSGEDTIILLHHHDVVDSSDYGQLSQYAYNPERLHKELSSLKLSEEIINDLHSNEWIFGRGTADMKAGAAIQMALIDKYSQIKDFKGNLLLLSVPDEESLSKGMIGAVSLLTELKKKFSLNYVLTINSEPHQRNDEKTGVIYEGSVGKFMPIIYVRGKQTHIGDVFQGFNPISLLSKIAGKIELNLDLSDTAYNEFSPPPSFAYFKDTKENYDVSTPRAAKGYFSILSLRKSPEEIINQLKELSNEAFEETIGEINNKYKVYRERCKLPYEKLPWISKVKTFAEVYDEAKKDCGDAFISDYSKTLNKLKVQIDDNLIDLPSATSILIEKTLEYVKDISPVVIISLVPPYYPSLTNKDYDALPEGVKTLSTEIRDYTFNKWNEDYVSHHYFMGISDMSYFYVKDNELASPFTQINMPLWGKCYNIPFEEIKDLSVPVINIGPWGKDLHKFSERVFKRDLLDRTPKIIEHVIQYIFS